MVRSAAALRGQLLDAALRLFQQRGFRGTSLQDIAREVGCSKASLLYHFTSKEAILVEVLTPCTSALDALADSLRQVPTSEMARRAVEGFVDVVIQYRQEISLVLAEVSETSAASADAPTVASDQRAERLVLALGGGSWDPQVRLRSWMAIGAVVVAATSPDAEDSPAWLRRELVDGTLRILHPPQTIPLGPADASVPARTP
ncbi:TetR/AcrR family transcriptional regulator [Frankia sp. AgPm24]|uniref:TetR/AcrR family transcriptional regulator n=1 Tax=Frankia umida TaxID=573489 RepID=A0ABT0JTZ2_9ACTN|nr:MULTISPECIES: TetR/AcrR family transcriptional regulator [Frankia]MCK9874984.1 TetR/AcrR family transcriptional regulator [Frankia umida]MCK9920530.1 TetR/AcrR family transcriptional regulator [Frankia sp. AgPm24]